MASMGQFRFSTLTKQLPTPAATYSRHEPTSSSPFAVSFPLNNNSLLLRLPKVRILNPLSPPKPEILAAAAGGGDGNNGSGNSGGGGGGGSGGAGGDSDSDSDKSLAGLGILGLFLAGWRDRVAADPQFAFKVLMEELAGVTANVLGDMASRPNFGLNELDFVFSTMIVGCIVNFTLMYLLAPAASAASSNLPWIFSNCPPSHMFQPGSFSLGNRIGTFAYKGATFAAVGFAAGLVGTAISNGLIKMRKKLDPNFETPNKAPPTVLNALTWAVHMGFNSNLRYQSLNGVEFVLAKSVSPLVFKSSVVVLRCLNNVLGGMTFVMLARLTGSQQSVEEEGKPAAVVEEVELGEGGDKIKEE